MDLFSDPPTDIDLCRKEINVLKEQLGNVRRGTFQRLNEQGKLIIRMQEDIDRLNAMMMKRIK